MVKYYSRSNNDNSHLYKLDESNGSFFYMDHCWTGKGIWCEREYPPAFEIVEITEERATEISKGNLQGNTSKLVSRRVR